MFESALGRYEATSGRLGTGAILSIAAHAIVVGGVLFFSAKKPPEKVEAPEIVFQTAKPPPLRGTPGGPPKTTQPEPKKIRPKPRNVPILTNEPPKPAEQTKEPEPSEAESTGNDGEGPGNGGVPDGSDDGVVGGTGPVTPTPPPPPEPKSTTTVMSFGADMDRPVLAAGPSQPEYPHEAKAAHIESVVIARCMITTDGSLRDCKIIKGHPFLNPAVEDLLAKRRYRPVLYGGAPVNVWYTMTFNFRLQ